MTATPIHLATADHYLITPRAGRVGGGYTASIFDADGSEILRQIFLPRSDASDWRDLAYEDALDFVDCVMRLAPLEAAS